MSEQTKQEPAEVVESNPTIPQVTNQQRELGAMATQEFEKKQYTPCLQIINKLMNYRANDPKVVHNKGVAEFYQSGFKTTDEYNQCLSRICKMAHINPENSESLEDVDHSIIYYNQAVILYHLRQYKAALLILEKLSQFVEPLDEGLCRRVLFLLVELFLQTYQPERSMGVLSYIEKLIFNGKGSSNNADKSERGDNSREGSAEEASANDAVRSKISVYRTRCLVMMKSMKSCKREIKSLMNVQGSSTSVLFLKSYFEYLRGNYRKAMKMLGSTPQSDLISVSGECLPVMYYNNLGCIHFQMKKPHLGAFYFRKALLENETAVREHATREPGKLSGKPLQALGMSKHYELLYNMGIQLLHSGKPMAAFDCLIEAVQMYQINPRLWLRLAECCIMANKENNEVDRQLEKRLEVIQGSVGTGVHRKLILGPGIKSQPPKNETPAIPAATMEFAVLCLRNALHLLPDDPAFGESAKTEESESGKANIESPLVPAPPANPMRACEVANLRCSILTAYAYTSLYLNDYIIALQHAEALLKQSRLSGAQRYLGHIYMAEALVALDRIADAVQHLNPDNINDISTSPPESKIDQEKMDKQEKGEKDKNDKEVFEQTDTKVLYPWSPRDLQRAKAIMQYNLATSHAIRGEYDKAMANLGESSKFIGTPLPNQMYLLKLYLDLIEGRRKMAQVVIKEHFGHMTPNRIEVKVNAKPGGWNDSSPP